MNAKITALLERLNSVDTTDGDELARLNYIINRHGEERHSHEATSAQLVVVTFQFNFLGLTQTFGNRLLSIPKRYS